MGSLRFLSCLSGSQREQADILKVFVAEVAEALDGKTADEIAASPFLAQDAEWLKRARDALARAGEG